MTTTTFRLARTGLARTGLATITWTADDDTAIGQDEFDEFDEFAILVGPLPTLGAVGLGVGGTVWRRSRG